MKALDIMLAKQLVSIKLGKGMVFVVRFFGISVGCVNIPSGGMQRFVAQKNLKSHWISTSLSEVSSKAMSQGMC